ncbi:hypothetical protein EVAR_5523_1 [Eumeta japonica]|uniref:Uncharacterized protein n=1 Tax=Eumeta variegata TaxID=151549 RepID=A0A4C1T9W7_EUMVA|nr:hypothetical protein EVAR_5523_1 [Eumeta japonica]
MAPETVVTVEHNKPSPQAPPQQDGGGLDWLKINVAYFKTPPGILKIIQLVIRVCIPVYDIRRAVASAASAALRPGLRTTLHICTFVRRRRSVGSALRRLCAGCGARRGAGLGNRLRPLTKNAEVAPRDILPHIRPLSFCLNNVM